MHAADDFLRAIEAEPGDRTRRLVFADWLDERSDPRGELIRVEEEMRTLPVFSDRFWELKPRRNALRELAGVEWCGRMRYGTECEPVFRHGIPGGWRKRWRLVREFTERWHRVPMPDVGGRQMEIAEAEARLGRKLPPSVREWIAFGVDVQSDKPDSVFPDQFRTEEFGAGGWEGCWEAVGLSATYSGSIGFGLGVRFSDLSQPDPPVFGADFDSYDLPGADAPDLTRGDNTVTRLAFCFVVSATCGANQAALRLHDPEYSRIRAEIEVALPRTASWGEVDLHETNNILVAFGFPRRGSSPAVWVKRAPSLAIEALPPILQLPFRRLECSSDAIPF